MSFPVAVSPSVITPGIYVTVDLTASSAAQGLSPIGALLLAPKTSAGDLTVDTEIRAGAGEASAKTAFGVRGLGYLMAKLLYQEAPQAPIDFGAPTAGAGTATRNITLAGSPDDAQAVEYDFAGRVVEVAWNAGETADTHKTRAIAAINAAYFGEIPTICTSGGVGVITVDAPFPGRQGNDIRVRARLVYAQTNTETVDTNTFTNLAGGTTDPDFTTILAAAAAKEYHFIVVGVSNTDAQSSGGTSNPARVETHINALNEGLDAKLQQCIYASSGSIANAKTGAIARNEGTFEHVCCKNGLGLPGELAAREAGGRLRAVAIRASTNRIGEVLDGYYGSKDKIADQPTASETEDALGNGVSIVRYTANGDPIIVRPVTTYCQDANAAPDRRLLDVLNVDVAYVVVRDIRDALPQEFPNVSVVDDQLPGAEDLPDGVVEIRDIRAWTIERLVGWADAGVIQRTPLLAAIADGTLAVRINPSDPTQVDIVIPFKAVQPLAKVGVVGQRQPG